MHVLVTGGAGYIGSVLVPVLVGEGYNVTVVDNLTFGNNLLGSTGYTLHHRDALDIDPNWLEDVDVVVHLAGLSNDPMANFRPRDNYIHNTALSGLLVYLCKQKGVKRFIFGGTCSIYGFSADEEMNEQSPVAPSFPYGISKMQCEYALNSAVDDSFRPILFRQATVYGWSPRMRFDLVVNTMTKYGVCYGKIIVHNPDLWRPLIHIRDLVRAYVLAIKAPDTVWGTFNISADNHTVLDIAKRVQNALLKNDHPCDLEIRNHFDARSYRVDGSRGCETLGFRPGLKIEDGVVEILDQFAMHDTSEWENLWYINAEVYRKKVILEEKRYSIWKKFLNNFREEFDHVGADDWPQEGP